MGLKSLCNFLEARPARFGLIFLIIAIYFARLLLFFLKFDAEILDKINSLPRYILLVAVLYSSIFLFRLSGFFLLKAAGVKNLPLVAGYEQLKQKVGAGNGKP